MGSTISVTFGSTTTTTGGNTDIKLHSGTTGSVTLFSTSTIVSLISGSIMPGGIIPCGILHIGSGSCPVTFSMISSIISVAFGSTTTGGVTNGHVKFCTGGVITVCIGGSSTTGPVTFCSGMNGHTAAGNGSGPVTLFSGSVGVVIFVITPWTISSVVGQFLQYR